MTGLHTALAALADEWSGIAERWNEHLPRTAIHRAHANRLRNLLVEHPATLSEELPECRHSFVGDGATFGPCQKCGARDDNAPADLPVATDSTTAALIERSSFGTPEATALRASVSDEVAARVVARVKELEADAPAPAPEPSDRAGLSEIRARIERYRREWLWQEADQEHVARWGFHMGQMLYRLPKDGQTTDMQASIEAMIADLGILADRLAAVEQGRDEARAEFRHWSDIATDEQVARQAAEQEAATLRAQVAAVEALAGEWDHEYARITATGRPPLALLRQHAERLRAALGDSAQVVQRIKDEAAADELEKAADEVTEDGGAWDVLALYVDEAGHPYALEGIRRWLRERAGRVRDGGE